MFTVLITFAVTSLSPQKGKYFDGSISDDSGKMSLNQWYQMKPHCGQWNYRQYSTNVHHIIISIKYFLIVVSTVDSPPPLIERVMNVLHYAISSKVGLQVQCGNSSSTSLSTKDTLSLHLGPLNI